MDPNRVKKDEFLHRLHQDHGSKDGVTPLDASEMAAANAYVQNAMAREGVDLTAKEVLDTVGDMVHVIGGDTSPAQRQIKEAKARRESAARYERKRQANAKALLERPK